MAEDSSVTGWVANEQGLADRRALAGRLVGKRIVEVQYVDLDYRGWDLGHHDQTQRRAITDESEWRIPTWDAGQFHHVDLGIEFTDENGKTWSVTWDLPGDTESLRLQQGPASEAGAAVWDVTDREPWRSCIDSAVTDVQLRYHPWEIGAGSFCAVASRSFSGPVEWRCSSATVGSETKTWSPQRTTSPSCWTPHVYPIGSAPTTSYEPRTQLSNNRLRGR